MTQRLKSAVIKFLKVTIPLLLGVIILYFLYKGTNFSELWATIQTVNWGILFFSLLFGLSGNVIRGLRWELIVKPLGYSPKKSNLIYAVLGSYAVNFALPRLGEVWRTTVIAKEEKIPISKLIGTLIIDRVFDMVMVILFIIAAFFLNVREFYQNRQSFDIPDILVSPSFYLYLLLGIVTILFVFFLLRENKIVKNVWLFFVNLWRDILSVKRMKEKNKFIFYTFGIWISYFLYFFITFFAFDFTSGLGISAALFVFALSSVSMAIPSNGGLGPWQAAVVVGLCAFAINAEDAKAFATAVFAVQSIWVVLCGLFGIVMLSVKKKKI